MTAKWKLVGAETQIVARGKTYRFVRDVAFTVMIGRTASKRVSRGSIQPAIGVLIGQMSTRFKGLVDVNLSSQLWRRVAAI
jgi:hypothetical protein